MIKLTQKSLFTITILLGTVSFPTIHRDPNQSVLAQQSRLTLSQAWQEGNGFTSFEWLSATDKEKIYSSAVYTEVKGNTLNIYNTYNRHPLGKYAACGGLGCDLGKGQLFATLNFEYRGNQFLVKSATASASFLRGAQCRVVESYMQVLECKSPKDPQGRNSLSIIQFAPGT